MCRRLPSLAAERLRRKRLGRRGRRLEPAAWTGRRRPATTHHAALDDRRATGAVVTPARVVDEGDLITAGGVTSGLDLALWVVERWFGAPAAAAVERQMEYE